MQNVRKSVESLETGEEIQFVQSIVPEVLLVDIDYGDIDKRVENKVAFLNSRCPLSGEGCGWKGKLREIEQHMEECLKVRVKCQLKCGNVLERENIEQHNREICPLRIIQCIYCNQEMQAKEQNRHIGQCRNHPDTEVKCPYKELGCEVIVLRKDRGIHITENMTDHHTLMLNQLNQLRNRNDQLERVNQQLRNRVTIIETSAIDREGEHTLERNTIAGQRKQDMKVASRRVIFVCTAIVICIIVAATIGIPLTVTQGNNIKANSVGINSNLQQIEASLQLIESLLSNASYIYEYIEERGKALLGIEWIYNLNETENLYGPTFYLGQCKLSLRAVAEATNEPNYEIYTKYYIERVEGKYDSVVSCIITYTYTTLSTMDNAQHEDTRSYDPNADLSVGESIPISSNYWANLEENCIVRVYFDTTEV